MDSAPVEEAALTASPAHRDGKVVHLTAAEIEEFEIELQTAGPGKMRLEKTFPGEVRTNDDRYAHVVPRVSGVVHSVHKSLGEPVRQGELMAVIESRELADLKSAYLAALERFSLAQAGFEREDRLFEKKISSEQEYLEAKQQLGEAQIELRAARQKLHALGFSERQIERLPDEPDASFVQYPLTAPISGTVVEKHITHGEALAADAEAFSIADLSTVWVDLSIYQKDMALVEKEQEVIIVAGNRRESGTISYVRPMIGEETRTAMARVVLPNQDEHWKPGMFVNGRILLGTKEVTVIVPRPALHDMDGRTVIFVKTAQGFEPRTVKVAGENEDQAAISSGLAPGEVFVVSGGFILKSQLQKSELGTGHVH